MLILCIDWVTLLFLHVAILGKDAGKFAANPAMGPGSFN